MSTARRLPTTLAARTTGAAAATSGARVSVLVTLLVAVMVPALALAGCSVSGAADEALPEPPSESVTAAPAMDLDPFYAQQLDWGDCDDIDPPEGLEIDGFECGTVLVPLDYDDPAGETIDLAVTRRPASGQRTGALVVNPGGPGASGVDYALTAQLVTTEALRDSYDIVGFDPRGISRSAAVECVDDATYDAFANADPSPDDTADLVELERLSGLIADGCAEDPVAPFIDTVSVVRDLDVLRAALGEDELTYLGKSYGTVLGAMYAELFPERVGRMVLDGAVDITPRAADDTQISIEQARGFEVALESFVADCLPLEDCPLTGSVPDGVGQVRALLASLETAPLPTADDSRDLGQGIGAAAILTLLYSYDLWPQLRAGLGAALSGDGQVLLFLHDVLTQRSPDGSYRGNAGQAIYAVNCLDGGTDPIGKGQLTVDDLDDLAGILATEAPTFGPQLAYGGLPCLEWMLDPVPWPDIDGSGAPAIVVVGTTRDPATPGTWAGRLADQLDSGVLVTFDGDGHTAYGATGAGCVDEALDAFWLDGTIPEDGLVCAAEY